MTVISSHNMTPLQNQSYNRSIPILELLIGISSCIIPIQILLHIIIHTRSQRVPDSSIQIHNRIRIRNIHPFQSRNIRPRDHLHKVNQIIRRPTEPKLQTQDVKPSILRLITGQILENLGQCPDQLQHLIRKTCR